jgi:penicillin amidase
VLLGGLALLLVLSGGMFWWALHPSLAQVDGRCTLPGLNTPVQIERDHFGVPTIHATNRLDATRALGLLHAQDRFFQMDLSRRVGSVGRVRLEVGPRKSSETSSIGFTARPYRRPA